MIPTLMLAAALLGSLPAGTTCTTSEEKILQRWQTLCDDGTRAVPTWNQTLSRWESIVTPPPGKTCTGQLNPHTRQVEGHCR